MQISVALLPKLDFSIAIMQLHVRQLVADETFQRSKRSLNCEDLIGMKCIGRVALPARSAVYALH